MIHNLPILMSETSQKESWRIGSLISFVMTVFLFLPTILYAQTSLNAEIVLLSEDFETGLGERWVEKGFPSISRRNIFSLDREANGNHYLNVKSFSSYSGKGVYLNFHPKNARW